MVVHQWEKKCNSGAAGRWWVECVVLVRGRVYTVFSLNFAVNIKLLKKMKYIFKKIYGSVFPTVTYIHPIKNINSKLKMLKKKSLNLSI